jgi:hypothetical protein
MSVAYTDELRNGLRQRRRDLWLGPFFDQVSGPLAIVVFAASKGGSSDKTVVAGAAVNAGKMERAIASIKNTVKATK